MVWNGMNISDIDMDATCKKISKLIDESELSDKELGEIMGLSVQSVNKWRNGHNIPDTENLVFLSRIFGIKVDDFFVPLVNKEQVELKFQPEVECFTDSVFHHLLSYCINIKEMKAG